MIITGRIIPNPYARMFAARRMAEAFAWARGARAQVTR